MCFVRSSISGYVFSCSCLSACLLVWLGRFFLLLRKKVKGDDYISNQINHVISIPPYFLIRKKAQGWINTHPLMLFSQGLSS